MAVLKGGILEYKEEAIGSIDGHNDTFVSSFPFIPGTLRVHLNGLEQDSPEDYVELDMQTIQFVNPPLGGIDSDVVTLTYQRQ